VNGVLSELATLDISCARVLWKITEILRIRGWRGVDIGGCKVVAKSGPAVTTVHVQSNASKPLQASKLQLFALPSKHRYFRQISAASLLYAWSATLFCYLFWVETLKFALSSCVIRRNRSNSSPHSACLHSLILDILPTQSLSKVL
jgi:hypothetical protein